MSISPVRILLFTSESCKFCPAVDKIVRRVVGAGAQGQVQVTTVDVDLNPEIAEEYQIGGLLPTVVIDKKVVLKGLMSEDDVKDRLWNSLFTSILERGKRLDKRKENMLFITERTMASLNKKELIRNNIGDYVHLGTLQDSTLSILALDRLAPNLLYDVGRSVGMYGASQMMLLSLNPNISMSFRLEKRFHAILEAIKEFYSNPEAFPLFISEDADILHIDGDKATLRIFGSAYAVGMPKIGEPLCSMIAGEMAGQVQVLLGRYVKVTETACWGLGDDYCEFLIETSDDEPAMEIFSDKGKKEVAARRQKFIDAMAEMAGVHEDSLFMKRRMRPRAGDFVHISAVQQAFTALKMIDNFTGMLLYSAGNENAITSPKKVLVDELSEMKARPPLDFNQAVKVIATSMAHVTSQLPRTHSFVNYEIVDDEEAHLTIEENVFSAGSSDLEMVFCDWTAGFIAGRMRLLTVGEPIVREIECQGTGAERCKFEISLD
ncbi:MAG: V4R domain-containing protein [Candidatus Hodarchaeales archaeon]|jgi:predicted hydrocarbon binding protein